MAEEKLKNKTNIELFDITVLYLSSLIYTQFPRCIEIDCYELLNKKPFINMSLEDIDKQILISETMFFLKENNFLDFTQPDKRSIHTQNDPYFSCVRLTARGLNILKSPPSSLEHKESIGAKIVKDVKEKSVLELVHTSADLVIDIAKELSKRVI